MKRLLKVFVVWLDRKFPDKVVFTPDHAKMLSDASVAVEDMKKKVKVCEDEIAKFNVSLGFTNVIPKSMTGQVFQR